MAESQEVKQVKQVNVTQVENQVEKKEVKKRVAKKQRKIVGVKDLEAEFGISGKQIRRHLRKMNENKKPRGPEPYQWYSDDPNYTKIRNNFKEIMKRKVTLHGK